MSCQNGNSTVSKTKYQHTEDSIKAFLPDPIDYVNDFERILTRNEINSLISIIDSIKKTDGPQFAIITWDTSSMPKMDFELLNLATANKWGIGDKDKHNGILIGVSKGLRKINIQNGFGIAKVYSNEETKNIIEQTIKPFFKQGQFYDGLKAGMLKMTEELRGRI
jgi:uncharacterized protein